MAVAIKRHTHEARLRGKAKRYQRRFPTPEAAVAAAGRWIQDPDVKAVWVFDGDTEVMHAAAVKEREAVAA